MSERNNQLKVDKKQVALLGIAGLRDTPNRGNTWGQNGLTAEGLKKKFDELPLHVADKLNGLIDALGLGSVVVLDKKGNAYTLAEIASMAQTGGGGSGDNGATFTPDVSEDGILSWTNDKDLPNPAPVKVKGKDGKTAYDYAKDGGYKGSEADFAARLAEDIPRSLSDLENDVGFIDAEGAPVQSVNGKKGAVSLLYEDVGADPSGTAYTEVSTHNTSDDAHSDIRLLLSALASRVNTALNSSDVDLDQLHEIVAYIKNNSSLIAGVTTSKVNVSDIIDNLTTNMASKPLSAAQGVVLKALVDGKISLSGLQGAISSALAEAKASGEFDGQDGVGIAKIEQTGSAGTNIDIYTITLTNGTSYTFSVTNGTKGDPGKDGTSPTVAVSKSGKVTTITLTDKNGTKTATINDGADGSSVSVSSVSESTASGGSNVVTFSDGKKMTVKNGKDGDDYVLTADDRNDIASLAVIKLRENGVVGVSDGNNTILLSGKPGTYTLKYEDENGAISEITTITIGNGPKYTNQLPLAIDTDGKIYDGDGYAEGVRLSSSGALTTASGYCLTGFIPCVGGVDVVRMKNITVGTSSQYIALYDANFAFLSGAIRPISEVFTKDADGVYTGTIWHTGAKYFRISISGIDATSIITVNEEIVDGGEPGSSVTEVDLSAIGYTDNARWSLSEGTIRTGMEGYTAINTIPFTRPKDKKVIMELSGIEWVTGSSGYTAVLAYAGDVFYTGASLYLRESKDYSSDTGFKTVCHDDKSVTLEISKGDWDGVKLCGYGSGANAKITMRFE